MRHSEQEVLSRHARVERGHRLVTALVLRAGLLITVAALPAAVALAQAAPHAAIASEPTSNDADLGQDDEHMLRLRGELEGRDQDLTLRLRVFSVMAAVMVIPIPLLLAKYFWRSDEGRWNRRGRLQIGWRFGLAGAGILTGVVGALVSGTQRHRERRSSRTVRVAPVVLRARGERGGGAVLELEF